jgi:hypothetical protein
LFGYWGCCLVGSVNRLASISGFNNLANPETALLLNQDARKSCRLSTCVVLEGVADWRAWTLPR